MANSENIKPYADLVREAAQHGGADNFVNEIKEASRQLGIEEEKATELWKGAVVLGVGIALWEGAKAGVRGIKKHRAKKKAQRVAVLKQRSEVAEKAILQKVQQATAEESSAVADNIYSELEEQ